MDKILFTFDETGEEVTFAVLGSVQVNEIAYILVVDQKELDEEDMTAYILKAVEADDVDVFYNIVDDEKELSEVVPMLEKYLTDYEID